MVDIRTLEISFLEQVCKNAHGDISKNIEIAEVAKSLSLDESSEEYPPEVIVIIIEALKHKHFIVEGDKHDQIKVTRDGINNIISMEKESATNYGVISINEINNLYPNVLEFIYNRTKNNSQKGVPLSEIKEATLNPYGEMVLPQMIDFLIDKNFVEGVNDNYTVSSQELFVNITADGMREIKRRTSSQKT